MSRAAPKRIRFLRIALLGMALAVTGVVHQRMDASARVAGGERFVPQPEHAKLSALGFDAVLSDFYWLQAVQILGGEERGVAEHGPLLARLIDVVTTLNPWVGHPYRFAAVWLTQDEELVRQANTLLERSIAYHPLDWRNRYHLGFNHFFYLEERARAAEILEPAVSLEGAPRYLGALVARLRGETGGLKTAAAFLVALARDTEDEYARAEYLKALDEIETERRARLLDRAREEFWRRRDRDLEAVEELLAPPRPVLGELPRAHPHFDGFEWALDEESGQIVSSFYRSRYELHVHPLDRARQERWRQARKANSEGIR